MGEETDDLALGSLDANLADFVQFWRVFFAALREAGTGNTGSGNSKL